MVRQQDRVEALFGIPFVPLPFAPDMTFVFEGVNAPFFFDVVPVPSPGFFVLELVVDLLDLKRFV